MPLFVFGVDIAKPQITFDAVNGCGKIARGVVRGDALTLAIGRFFVVGRPEHGMHPLDGILL
jgi:hypothetical protein